MSTITPVVFNFVSTTLRVVMRDGEREAGRLLIKRVLRGGEAEGPVLEEATRLMNAAVASDEAELAKLMRRWQEAEVTALTERKSNHYGDHLAAYVEPMTA